jgi:hypothetical protein
VQGQPERQGLPHRVSTAQLQRPNQRRPLQTKDGEVKILKRLFFFLTHAQGTAP